MVPKPSSAATTRQIAGRPLPPLPKLHIRKPNKSEANPCIGIMTSVLGCWASSGNTMMGCAALEQQLRACMDAPRPAASKKSSINYHLARFHPKITGPHKRD